MSHELIFTRARVVQADRVLPHGTVVVRNGVIADVASQPSQVRGAQDLGGDWLLPGMVELHTDGLERHVMPRPKVSFPMQAAVQAHDAEIAASGITTVLDAIGVGDPYGDGFRSHDQSALLDVLDGMDAVGLLRADHRIHVRCELPAGNARELFEPFSKHRRLLLISLMDHTPGQRQWSRIEQARVFYTGKKGWSDEQFDREVQIAPERQARHAVPNRVWFIDFARQHGVVLATHDDTTPAHVDEAVEAGAAISEFPTTLEAARHAKRAGLATVMGAPNVVRGGSHSGNIAAIDLAREGLLDALSSDYVPASLLQAAWSLVRDAGFTPPEAMAVVSLNPALACGLLDRGQIAVGKRGDVVRVRELNGVPVVREVWRGEHRVA